MSTLQQLLPFGVLRRILEKFLASEKSYRRLQHWAAQTGGELLSLTQSWLPLLESKQQDMFRLTILSARGLALLVKHNSCHRRFGV